MTDDRQPLITPQMKVGELLEAYPELEAVLIEIAPAFKKLRNPVLRKTVARVTTLAQAARVGGVPVAEIVKRLRGAAGQPEWSANSEVEGQPGPDREKPDWLKNAAIRKWLDARPMIEAGEQPIAAVLRDLNQLPDDAVYELITPFEPAPLIDRAKSTGFTVWTAGISASEYRSYFVRQRKP